MINLHVYFSSTWKHKHTFTSSCPALPHVYTDKSTIQHNTVANHRTKGGSSQQAFPLISYRRQRGGTAVGFVEPGRSHSSITGRGKKSNTSTKLRLSVWYETLTLMMACCSTPLKSSLFFLKNNLHRLKPGRGSRCLSPHWKTKLLIQSK